MILCKYSNDHELQTHYGQGQHRAHRQDYLPLDIVVQVIYSFYFVLQDLFFFI